MRKSIYSICHYDTSKELLHRYRHEYVYVYLGGVSHKYVAELVQDHDSYTRILIKNLSVEDKVLLTLQGHLEVANLDRSFIQATVIASL